MTIGSQDPLVLRYDHNVIEHLGLKLYQNRPTRVIAELVSNSWDADSPEVRVKLNDEPSRWVAVHDAGAGMDQSVLAHRFLVIGAPKRRNPSEKSPGGRNLMGRKGIGKLAAFGIAKQVDVITVTQDSAIWMRLELDAILDETKSGAASYEPEILHHGTALNISLSEQNDPTGQVREFKEFISGHEGTGTLILMSDLTLKRPISQDQLTESLGRRLIASVGHDFDVYVNDSKVTQESSLPKFEFRIPKEGVTTQDVGGHEVSYWVGFVERADWPQDQAGVGVYSHGKIAQDRPFTFGVKGKEIYTRYMYAVVKADWLDEQDTDLISTDRTSVDWDSEHTSALYEWGTGKVREWVREFESWRKGKEKDENLKRVKSGIETGIVPRITSEEQEQVADLLADVTPALGKDEDAKTNLANAVSSAWVQKPMRTLIRDLWSDLGSSRSMPEKFSSVVEKLASHTVPESLNLAVVFAQRAFALSKMYDYVHHGKELDLQKLIEQFPWIIEPDSAFLTADKTLKRVVLEAEEKGLTPTGRREKTVAGVPDRNKPDFVFLSSPDNERLIVCELKSPTSDLTIDNRQQLADYLTHLEVTYPDAEIKGYLIGRRPKGLNLKRVDMEIIAWVDVLKRSRARYVVFLAAMLSAADTQDDARIVQVREFGDKETRELLQQIAEKNPSLKDVMDSWGD